MITDMSMNVGSSAVSYWRWRYCKSKELIFLEGIWEFRCQCHPDRSSCEFSPIRWHKRSRWAWLRRTNEATSYMYFAWFSTLATKSLKREFSARGWWIWFFVRDNWIWGRLHEDHEIDFEIDSSPLYLWRFDQRFETAEESVWPDSRIHALKSSLVKWRPDPQKVLLMKKLTIEI